MSNLKNNISLSKLRDPSCLEQGSLHNHSLISILSAISDNIYIIQKLFEEQQVNDQGVYYVRICKDGIW